MTAATVVHAPNAAPPTPKGERRRPHVFLAGSIEMGLAEDWQARIIAALSDLDCVILNPRRPDWNANCKQEATNPQFRQQVEWELDQLDQADVIALYLSPGTMSPISLLELGLHADRSSIVVCCPAGFWRKGNVDIVCEREEIDMVDDLDHLAHWLRDEIAPRQPASIKRKIYTVGGIRYRQVGPLRKLHDGKDGSVCACISDDRTLYMKLGGDYARVAFSGGDWGTLCGTTPNYLCQPLEEIKDR